MITLTSNEIFSALQNMIIRQEFATDALEGLDRESLLSKSRVDGGLYGDQIPFYDVDVLRSFKWGADAESVNLLKTYRPTQPKVQSIKLDIFRQIPITIDYYLTKRAWMNEGAFSQFNSLMLGWIRDTKEVYDYTTFNTFLGTDETNVGKQTQEITLPADGADIEQTHIQEGMAIANFIANLIVDLRRPQRGFTDNGFLKSRSTSKLAIVWNAKALNKITKYVLPVLFHKEGFIDKFTQYVLPEEYFGTKNSSGSTTGADNKTVRSLIEKDYNDEGLSMSDSGYDAAKHIFPGDLLPNSTAYGKNETYTQDATILFKIVDERSIPFMSAFEVGTSFYNPKALNENHYLTWGHNTLQHRKDMPFITVRGVKAVAAAAANAKG